ncbi:hypothetical protein KM043_015665 [Ampulex compressa]|nr:hypothetical protein KM043_015665 [Ampulex compressa]
MNDGRRADSRQRHELDREVEEQAGARSAHPRREGRQNTFKSSQIGGNAPEREPTPPEVIWKQFRRWGERDSNKRAQYVSFMKEYQELGHMTEQQNVLRDDGYYLPHHAVFKETSLTTKLRVVFDGSARTTSCISLNDTLMFQKRVNYVLDFDPSEDLSIDELQRRLHEAECDFEAFEAIQNALETIVADDICEQRFTKRGEIEEVYYRYTSKAKTLLKTQTIANVRHTVELSVESVAQPSGLVNALPIDHSPLTITSDMQAKLPTIHLPKFSGLYEAWLGFTDAFRTPVHDDVNFRDKQKLIYLRSCLTSKALLS